MEILPSSTIYHCILPAALTKESKDSMLMLSINWPPSFTAAQRDAHHRGLIDSVQLQIANYVKSETLRAKSFHSEFTSLPFQQSVSSSSSAHQELIVHIVFSKSSVSHEIHLPKTKTCGQGFLEISLVGDCDTIQPIVNPESFSTETFPPFENKCNIYVKLPTDKSLPLEKSVLDPRKRAKNVRSKESRNFDRELSTEKLAGKKRRSSGDKKDGEVISKYFGPKTVGGGEQINDRDNVADDDRGGGGEAGVSHETNETREERLVDTAISDHDLPPIEPSNLDSSERTTDKYQSGLAKKKKRKRRDSDSDEWENDLFAAAADDSDDDPTYGDDFLDEPMEGDDDEISEGVLTDEDLGDSEKHKRAKTAKMSQSGNQSRDSKSQPRKDESNNVYADDSKLRHLALSKQLRHQDTQKAALRQPESGAQTSSDINDSSNSQSGERKNDLPKPDANPKSDIPTNETTEVPTDQSTEKSPRRNVRRGRKRLGRDTILRIQMELEGDEQIEDDKGSAGDDAEWRADDALIDGELQDDDEDEDDGDWNEVETYSDRRRKRSKKKVNGGKNVSSPKQSSQQWQENATLKGAWMHKRPVKQDIKVVAIDSYYKMEQRKTVVDMSDLFGEFGGTAEVDKESKDGDKKEIGSVKAQDSMDDDELPSEKTCWKAKERGGGGGAAAAGALSATAKGSGISSGKSSVKLKTSVRINDPDIAEMREGSPPAILSQVFPNSKRLPETQIKQEVIAEDDIEAERTSKRSKIKKDNSTSIGTSSKSKSSLKSGSEALKSWLSSSKQSLPTKQPNTSSSSSSSRPHPVHLSASVDLNLVHPKPSSHRSRQSAKVKRKDYKFHYDSSPDSLSQEVDSLNVKDGVPKMSDGSGVDLAPVGSRNRRNPCRAAASAIKTTYSSSEDEDEGGGGESPISSFGGSQGDQPGANYQGDARYIPGSLTECCRDETDLRRICMGCIEKLLWHHRRVCVNIRKGECYSRRHDDYKMGGKARVNLNYQIHSMNVYSDEQHEFVERWLMKEFCRDGDRRHLDHCLRVLQPELFIRIYMDVHLCSFEEAELGMVRKNVRTTPNEGAI